MSGKTEYTELKRLLFAVAKNSKIVTTVDVNGMIMDASKDAFDGLEPADKRNVRRTMEMLQANVKGHFGPSQALEVLAAVGDYLNHNGNGHKESEE